MSKPLAIRKQTSLESPGLSYQQRRAQDEDKCSPNPLNRSLTVVDRRASASGRRPRGSSSPLERFARAKDSISKAFELIQDRLKESQAFLKLVHNGVESKPVLALLESTRGIEDILLRDHMKVAFFGRTSNGKSTVINALLHSKVLPAGIGHTTNCFCSVIGADSEEGYLLPPGSQERQNVQSVQQLAHSLHKKHLQPSSLVQVFWPKAKCALLKDDVEFVDSPGVDMNPDMDEWIDKHCLDADVFVLVSNAESTLMTAEKNFFHRVSEKLSKPNIFILNNRWDASAQEPDLKNEVRAQHMDCDVGFLAHELRVMDEQTARNRVFFVSAKEVLQLRTRQQDENRGLADGHMARNVEFEMFEQRFKECISSAAIRTKFEHHHRRGMEVVRELEELLAGEERNILKNSETMKNDLQNSVQRQRTLHSEGSTVAERCQQKITSTATAVDQKISVAMRDLISQLATMVDEYEGSFDPTHLETYKHGLYKFMDERLGKELGRVGGDTLGRAYDEAHRMLIDTYQKLLQLPHKELSQFSPLVSHPELSYVMQCAELCEDFREDLEFHFSLGITSVLQKMNVSSPSLGSVQDNWSLVRRVVPVDLAFPIAAGVVLLAAAILPHFLNWRLLLPGFMLYGGVYTYERIAWTVRSKENALKQQFVWHMRDKVQVQITATSRSYTRQLEGRLGMLLQGLRGSLGGALERETSRIQELTDEQGRLVQLQDRAKKLRNAVHLLQMDLENFKEGYLDGDSS